MKRLGEKTKKNMEAVWNKSTNKKKNNLKIPENLVIEKQPAFVLDSPGALFTIEGEPRSKLGSCWKKKVIL